MGQIRKRGGFYQIRYYRNGQRIEESDRVHEVRRGARPARDREGDISKGVPITAHVDAAHVRRCREGRRSTDYTVNGKKSIAELERRIKLHLTPVFGGRRLSAITTADLRAFVAARLEAKAAPAEINRELAIVRRAFRLAVEADKYHGRVPKIRDAAGAQRAERVFR